MNHYMFLISYSCYTEKMTVLLNGKNMISQNSALLQYMNEPFYKWCTVLPELLYRELGEDYSVIYQGRDEEAKILSREFDKEPHCIRMETRKYELSKTIQERMIELSKMIKSNHLIRLPGGIIDVVFVGRREMLEKWKHKIEQIDVHNQYCTVKIHMTEQKDTKHLPVKSVPFFLTEETGASAMKDTDVPWEYSFLLSEKTEPGYCKVDGNTFIYGIDENHFFDVVFECLLLFPLAECFAHYALSLSECVKDLQMKRKLQALLSVKPCVYIQVENKIERGCSVPVLIQTEPENAKIPGLMFDCRIPGIVSCSQQRIYGEKAGKTQILVYEKGMAEPFDTLEIEVYERNRIREIDLSDYSQMVGAGSVVSLTCTYYPADADNTDKLQWYSDNREVAVVNRNGTVTALTAGTCRIYCAAESVAAYCQLEVKPYLRSMKLPDEAGESVLLKVGETKKILCKTEPEGAIDGKLIFTSSNLMVANAGENTVTGVSDGEAEILVENVSGRFRESFHVIVGKGEIKEPPRKKKFFGIFG